MDMKTAVQERYSQGAQQVQEALCCPVDYDAALLKALPREIIDRDYGCGDPSRYVRSGDTVLDLGSGSGKICYMAAQLVGAGGSVIGVDMNQDMLALARKYQADMAAHLGEERVRFCRGQIQDLALDLDSMDAWLLKHPVSNAEDYAQLETWAAGQRAEAPMIADDGVDLVISNCVLNLVGDDQKTQLVNEIFRVLKPGGRVAISDIVCDEPISDELKADAELWSGCLSGAFQEQEFVQAFVRAGFQAVCFDKWSAEPWRVIDDTEFRSVTLTAVKSQGQECWDYGHAVIYRGPFNEVFDDDGHRFPRGERIAVCERTFALLTGGTYSDNFIGIAPRNPGDPQPWCTPAGTCRAPAESKGGTHISGDTTGGCC